jgi:PAS domain S-box-containing protein
LQLDELGRILRCVQRDAVVCEGAEGALIGRRLAELLMPASAASLTAALGRASEGDKPQRLGLRLASAPGRLLDGRLGRAPGGALLTLREPLVEDPQAQGGSERFYHRFFHLIPSLAVIMTADGRAMHANESWRRVLGHDPSVVVGHLLREFIHEEDKAAVIQEREALPEGRPTRGFLSRLVSANGEARWFVWDAIHDSETQLLYSIAHEVEAQKQHELALLQTVHELRQTEQRLRRSEALLVEMGRMAQVGAWEASNGTFFWTDELYRIHEVAPGVLPDLGLIHDRILPGPRRQLDEAIEKMLATDEPFDLEMPYQAPSGQLRWLRSHGRIDRSGEGVRLFGATQDITNQKQIELALIESRRRLDEVYAVARVGSWEFDLSTGYIAWSNVVFDLFGFPRGQATPSYEEYLARLSPADRVLHAEEVQVAIRDGIPYTREYRVLPPGGEERYVRSTGSPVRNDNGKIVALMGIAQDITVSRRVEQELIAAREAAVLASRTKSQFLANMSHEIRTPMNAVLGMTALALDTELTSEQREYLETVLSSGKALMEIIDDILDLSKIEAGKVELERAPFSVGDIILETARLFSTHAHEKGLELLVDLGPEIPARLLGDPTRFRQVISNLLGNALKFTHKGIVAVRARWQAQPVPVLSVRIEDTGIGIAPGSQSAIFEPFVQADGSTSRRFGGTGLGLAICKQLVQLMGGQMEVESLEGHGATFRFTAALPVASSQPAADPRRLGGLRVLVVDDSRPAGEVLCSLVERRGGEASLVTSVAAGVAAIREAQEAGRPFQVALIDCEMPAAGGLVFGARMSRMTAAPRLVLLTAARRPSSDELRSAGFERSMSKPVGERDLLDALLRGASSSSLRAVAVAAPVRSLTSSGGRLVLVAEDNAVNAKLVTRLLEKLGFRVALATTGVEAVARAAQGGVDLVLMDVQMPEMDGLEATRQIRAHEATHGGHVPIVALTANAMKGDDSRCLTAGMDAYLDKPVDPGKLQRVLGRALDPRPPVFDREDAMSRVGGDDEIFRDLVGVFLDTYQSLLDSLDLALSQGQRARVQSAAHTLKGALGALSAHEAVATATTLELQARDCDEARLLALGVSLKREVDRLVAELQRI